MDTPQITAAATQCGIPPEAIDHVISTVRTHFGSETVKPADVASYISNLPVWTRIGMSYEAFATMPMTWRLAQGWAHQAPPVSRRPETRILTAEELASLKGLAWAEYLTRGREMQQTPPPPSPDAA
jgi:hypothetical protein